MIRTRYPLMNQTIDAIEGIPVDITKRPFFTATDLESYNKDPLHRATIDAKG